MIILISKYLKPLEDVDKYLAAHRIFLKEAIDKGELVVCGSLNPRTGGVIISKHSSVGEARRWISSDPFVLNSISEYEVIEFNPTLSAPDFGAFL